MTLSPVEVRDLLVRAAFDGRPEAVAVVLTWRQGYINPTEPFDLAAFTCTSHFDAAMLSAGTDHHSAVYTRGMGMRR